MNISESTLQVFSLFLANAALILWFRAESRSDWRHMDNKLDTSITKFDNTIKIIQDEMKDFHKQLISIEKQRLNLHRKRWK